MSEIVTGYHAIEELLREGRVEGSLHLERENPRIERLMVAARRSGLSIIRESPGALDRMCGHGDHRGALLVVTGRRSGEGVLTIDRFVAELASEQALVLVLCGVTDPQNLGAILRSADQFQVDLVVLPERRAAHESETVARASSGAAAYVRSTVVANLARALALLKGAGFWVYGAEMRGEPADRSRLSGRTALVLGSEGGGVPQLIARECDALIRIPSRGHIDSFNVSVAAGILLYEARRQQGFLQKWEEPQGSRQV